MPAILKRRLSFCAIMSALVVGIASSFGATIYQYDSLNRLTNVNYGNGSVISYTYDPAGNRLTYSAVVSSDTTPPTIAITSPTTGPGYTNTTATINLSGNASDNVGVTLVTWQNYSGGLGVATGTNSWSITGIPLQPGANDIIVTAYDAAGNSTVAILIVTFAPGTGTTTSTVFSDNFVGNTIDPTKWTFYGNTVFQTNGIMEVLTTVTDAGGALTSLPIPINATGKITISRQVLVHYGNNYFDGQFGIHVGSLPWFSVWYANIIYSDGVNYMPRYGFFLARNNARPDVMADQADTSSAITPLWDTWFAEKTTYDPTSGIMEYFINNVSQGTYNVGAMPPTNSPTMTLVFTTWGWYTGHEQLFSNLVVTQVVPSSSQPHLSGPSLDNSGLFLFNLSGLAGNNYVIQVSSNLVNWVNLETNAIPSSGVRVFDFPIQANQPQMFYRALPSPQ
jgi:YD repeat-containing protein